MRKIVFVAAIMTFIFTVSSFAGRIVYTIDPSTAMPQAATVISNGEGETVIIFSSAILESGMAFSFRLDMTTKGDAVKFPVAAQMVQKGKKNYLITFEPVVMLFDGSGLPVSSVITFALPEKNYSGIDKVKVKIKADTEAGKGAGSGPGVKIIVVKASSTREFMDAVRQEIQELYEE